MVVREGVPGVAALGVVLAHRAPGALAQVRAPLVPGVRGEEVVLGAAGRLGEAGVLGRRRAVGVGIGSVLRGSEWRQSEEVPGPRVERDVEPVAEVVAAPLVALAGRRRRRAATPARAARPTAARRGRTRARRRGSRRRARRDSPRQPQATRFCQVSLPSQPLRSPSCHSPVAEDAVARARPAAARRTPSARGRPARRAGGRGRPAAAPSGPRAGPRGRAGRPSGSAPPPPRRAPSPAGNVAAARGSSWFSMKRTSRSW